MCSELRTIEKKPYPSIGKLTNIPTVNSMVNQNNLEYLM